jgi:hypothetical protein
MLRLYESEDVNLVKKSFAKTTEKDSMLEEDSTDEEEMDLEMETTESLDNINTLKEVLV